MNSASRGRPCDGLVFLRRDDGDAIVEQMHVVRRFAREAPEADDAGLRRRVDRVRIRADPAHDASRAGVVGSPASVNRAPRRSTPAAAAAWQIRTAELAIVMR